MLKGDKNKNNIPDWLESAIFWSSSIYILSATLKKVLNGDSLEDSMNIAITAGESRDNESVD